MKTRISDGLSCLQEIGRNVKKKVELFCHIFMPVRKAMGRRLEMLKPSTYPNAMGYYQKTLRDSKVRVAKDHG